MKTDIKTKGPRRQKIHKPKVRQENYQTTAEFAIPTALEFAHLLPQTDFPTPQTCEILSAGSSCKLRQHCRLYWFSESLMACRCLSPGAWRQSASLRRLCVPCLALNHCRSNEWTRGNVNTLVSLSVPFLSAHYWQWMTGWGMTLLMHTVHFAQHIHCVAFSCHPVSIVPLFFIKSPSSFHFCLNHWPPFCLLWKTYSLYLWEFDLFQLIQWSLIPETSLKWYNLFSLMAN